MDALFKLARELASPQIWSAGVELARNADFQEEASAGSEERAFRVIRGPRDKILRVTLSEESELWQCDCGSDLDPCSHVVGTIIAVRQGIQGRTLVRASTTLPGGVVHIFQRQGKRLAFSRALAWEESRTPVQGSLHGAIESAASRGGGAKRVVASNEELQIDHVLGTRKEGVLEPRTMRLLMPALSRVARVELDGTPITVSPEPLVPAASLSDEAGGYRIVRVPDPRISEIFENGAAIRSGVLCGIEDSSLSADEIGMLSGDGTFFPPSKAFELAGKILPTLEAKIKVEVRSTSLPRARRVLPRIVLETIADSSGERLTVVPHLVYGRPVIAEVRGNSVDILSKSEVPIRDSVEETRLSRELLAALHLKLNEAKVFTGEGAIRFVERMDGWESYGGGSRVFTPADSLAASLQGTTDAIDLRFSTPDGERSAAAEDVLRAYRMGATFVQLSGGGWGTIPIAWVREHLAAIERLLAAKRENEGNAARMLPDVAELCESLGMPCPEYFQRLKDALDDVTSIEDAHLPRDLTASLRPYQKVGFNWLSLLRKNGLGALLADDMGLGKTLQAICVLAPRSIVVAPTSVLYSWREQLRKFRPGLSVCVYHGGNRTLLRNVDVVITTYAIMRLDIDLLEQEEWDTVVLDEAQTIRNPDSQVSRAAYRLKGGFRLTLSGTPVENSLQDIWSQFNFIAPGLLGVRREFERRFEDPITRGDARAVSELRRRVQPFMLRRLKRDVASDLPPKTEVVLECELSQDERQLYEAVLGASRRDIVERLESGESVFSVLEVLLRLRQACCHTGLLPGHSAESSSKVDLLAESLERSIAQGHRALVFSQWTGLLDLIEPHLTSRAITFSRIDGSTDDRAALVDSFQRPDGPSVMLLSLKAGGLGLTLTAADHVYIVDPWWNPAAEDQAGDRAHRIGQENPVIVHRLVASDTIEERILELQDRKRALLAAAVGEQGSVALSRDDVLALLK